MDRFKVGDRVRYLGKMVRSRTEFIGEIGTVVEADILSCTVMWDNKCPGIGNPRSGNIELVLDEGDNIPEKW